MKLLFDNGLMLNVAEHTIIHFNLVSDEKRVIKRGSGMTTYNRVKDYDLVLGETSTIVHLKSEVQGILASFPLALDEFDTISLKQILEIIESHAIGIVGFIVDSEPYLIDEELDITQSITITSDGNFIAAGRKANPF